MQIPQGMGYALLARLPAIIGKMTLTKFLTKSMSSFFPTGLYISFFSSLVYALFGTSRHLSMG